MAKFEVEMELQGFKLRVKGERSEDIPRISGEIGKQLAGMLQPPAHLLQEPIRKHVDAIIQPSGDDHNAGGTGRAKGGRRRKASSNNGSSPVPLITWQHDPAKWGTPKQGWTEGNKTLWLLYVMKSEIGLTEVGGPTVADIFNSKFKHFGPLRKSNIPRAFGRLKTNDPALVMDDTTKTPIAWYLTDAGLKEAERLVQEAKTPEPPQATP